MRKQPQSKFEKLFAGLKVIIQHQPAAEIKGTVALGNPNDKFITEGMKQHLRGLGFDTDGEHFIFKVDE
jgi:hypothetical protein